MVATNTAEATPPTDDLGHTIVFTYSEYTLGLTAVYLSLHPFLIDLLSLIITPGEAQYTIDLFLNKQHESLNESGFYARIIKRQ
jgi:hypothetical protein